MALHNWVELPDGRVVNVAAHATSPQDLAMVLWDAWAAAYAPKTGWPGVVLSAVQRVAHPPPTKLPGHLLTYDGLATRCGLVDADLRQVVIATGVVAVATVEASTAFGNVLDAAMAEQQRRQGGAL